MTIDETMRQMTRRSSLRLILAGGASIILPSCFLDSRGLATGGPDSPWEVDGGSEPAPPYNPPESDAGTDGDADGDADGADGGCGYTSEELPERVFNVLPVDQNYTGRLDEHLRNQTIPETGKTIRELSALADSAGTKYSASSLADLYRSEPYDAEHDLRQAIYDDFHDLNGHADELLCGRTDEETVRATIDELFDQIFDDGSLQTNYELLDHGPSIFFARDGDTTYMVMFAVDVNVDGETGTSEQPGELKILYKIGTPETIRVLEYLNWGI